MPSPKPITIRPPLTPSNPSPQPPTETYTSPPLPWLLETWHVTHSTLPMWKSKRNVRIQYTSLAPSEPSITAKGGAETDRLDDLVTYQGIDSSKVSSIRGIDKAAKAERRDVWDWRGRGWLVIAGSRWEVIGWGEEDDDDDKHNQDPVETSQQVVRGQQKNKWVVTLFAKTLFTPQGIDIYSLSPRGVKSETLEEIKRGLTTCEDESVKKLASELFEVTIDGERKD